MTAPPDTAPTDAVLLAASVHDGDQFTAVYDRHYADVHRYVAGRLGAQAVEDVMAETRRYRALAQVGADRDPGGHDGRVAASVSAERLQPPLARALAELSRKDRDVVLLKALAQLTHEEIADVLGIPYGTVGSRLNRARKRLRAVLPAPAEGL